MNFSTLYNSNFFQILCNKSIALYNRITRLHQIDHLAVCSNFEFPAVKTKMLNAATFHLKETLMLVADADDARSAQDKLYEWKIINQPLKQ